MMDELFETANKNLNGQLKIERKTLEVGDYHIKPDGQEPFIVTFKEYSDFRTSFFNGHLFEEIAAIYEKYPDNTKALIIARNEHRRTKRDIITWVSNHWRKRNFIIPAFKFGSREKAVEYMIDCGMKLDTLQTIPRTVQKPPNYHETVGVCSFYGVGAETAVELAERYPKPIDMFEDMKEYRDYEVATETWEFCTRKWFEWMPDAWKSREGKKLTKKAWKEGRWWFGILGVKTATRIEGLILDGKTIQRRQRVR